MTDPPGDGAHSSLPTGAPPDVAADNVAVDAHVPAGDVAAGVDDDSVPGTYEATRTELEAVVARLEAGGVTLEETLELWDRGERLARACHAWLEGARSRLQAAVEADLGSPSTGP